MDCSDMAETAEIIAEEASTVVSEEVEPHAHEKTGSAPASVGDESVSPGILPTSAPTPEAMTPDKAGTPTSKTEERQPLTCTAILAERYLIDGAAPLPNLDSPCALAYGVNDRENPDVNLFALVCQPGMPVRADAIRKHRSAGIRGVMPIHEWGYVLWEPAKSAVAIIIFEKPLGGKLSELIAAGTTRIGEYDVVQRVLIPITDAILSLTAEGLVHRAIRPDNLYYMDSDLTELVLGECVTTPPGYDQPVMYEGVERSMAPPLRSRHRE